MVMKILMVNFILIIGLLSQNNPLVMVGLLIFLSALTALMAMKIVNLWFFYTILIFYLGGMMIMFIYIASLAALKEVKMRFPFFFFGSFALIIWADSVNWALHKNQISFLYNDTHLFFPLVMALILLMALLTVNSLANNWQGPMKSKIYG